MPNADWAGLRTPLGECRKTLEYYLRMGGLKAKTERSKIGPLAYSVRYDIFWSSCSPHNSGRFRPILESKKASQSRFFQLSNALIFSLRGDMSEIRWPKYVPSYADHPVGSMELWTSEDKMLQNEDGKFYYRVSHVKETGDAERHRGDHCIHFVSWGS